MTSLASIPLKTMELLEYSVSVTCFVCGHGNNFDAASCRYCYAPLALTHQTTGNGCQPDLIAVLGAPSAGKTVYLGMLTDILSRQSDRLQLVVRGAFSVAMQERSVTSLSRSRFPPATADHPSEWNWMHCRVSPTGSRHSLELVLPDISGRSMVREFEPAPGCLALRSLMTKAGGALLLIDAAALASGEQDDEFFAVKAISNLCEINSKGIPDWTRRPIAIVLTKGDLAESSFDDPKNFLEQHAPSLAKLCHERLNVCNVFAIGTVGAIAYQRVGHQRFPVPLRIEPRGIVEPFEWLVSRLSRKGRASVFSGLFRR